MHVDLPSHSKGRLITETSCGIEPGTIQWLNPDAFVSAVDPSTGACYGGDNFQHCQFGSLGRNALRGPDFFWNDFYLTKWFPVTERVKLRLDAQFFNVFNHPNFGLPSMVLAGIPGKPSTQTACGALTLTRRIAMLVAPLLLEYLSTK
jgi:hypothetical protein